MTDWQNAPIPDTLRLACGADVPHLVGVRVWNYYDHKAGVIERLARYGQPDTSGLLPGGVAWWVEVRCDDGRLTSLDGSRMCSIEFAQMKGWIS